MTVTPALARLQAELVGLQAGSLAESTKAKYSQYEVYWVRFLLVFGLVWFVVQPTEAVVSLYVAFLARSVSYGTVKNYLQGLQRFLLDRGWSGHFSEWRSLQQALVGLRRRAKEVRCKLPITPFILLKVVQVLDFGSALGLWCSPPCWWPLAPSCARPMCVLLVAACHMCSVLCCAKMWLLTCSATACMSHCAS